MKLEEYGQRLRELRKKSGLTQAELARQLSITSDLISVWERAYQHRGRRWPPDRNSVVRLVEIFAGQLSPQESQAWVSYAGYRLSWSELQKLFPDHPIPAPAPLLSPSGPQSYLVSLASLPDQDLFGVSEGKQYLRLILEQANAPWLIAIDGIGGIGKTSLAAALSREIMQQERFYGLGWVSAKQEEFRPEAGRGQTNRPALDIDTLVVLLLEQLEPGLSLAGSIEEKKLLLLHLLKRRPYLIVIDNLETAVDYQALLPFLSQLANPGKFLLTSRHSLHAYPDVFSFSLKELSPEATLALLKHEAEIRGVNALINASQDQLMRIYKVAGGNPLALKLIVGQVCVLPLSQVLQNLEQARGKTIDDLYTYIYWQAWHALDAASQKLLLTMPLVQEGTIEQLTALSRFCSDDLHQALDHLIGLSLVEIGGDLEQRRYRIHRLTENFLLHELIKWQQ